MNKIGILTFHYVINEGALLQAYGVYSAFNDKFNARVEFVNSHSIRKEIGNLYLTLHSGYKNGILFKACRRYLNLKLSSYKFFKHCRSGFPFFSDDYRKNLSKIDNVYDLLVVGSDEVWRIDFESDNIMVLPWPNIYWLNSDLKCGKVSFAASANRSNIEGMKAYQASILRSLLSGFDLVSVRDEFTHEMLKPFSPQKQIVKIPDPSFYLNIPETKIESKLSAMGLDTSRKIFLCVINNKQISRMIRSYCDKNDYVMVAIEDANELADFNLIHNLEIMEWADIFRLSTVCVTDRFHGTIFSLKGKTPVLAMGGSDPHRCKIYNMLNEMNMLYSYRPHHSIQSQDDFDNSLSEIITQWDPEHVTSHLDLQKQRLDAFLNQVAESFPDLCKH